MTRVIPVSSIRWWTSRPGFEASPSSIYLTLGHSLYSRFFFKYIVVGAAWQFLFSSTVSWRHWGAVLSNEEDVGSSNKTYISANIASVDSVSSLRGIGIDPSRRHSLGQATVDCG